MEIKYLKKNSRTTIKKSLRAISRSDKGTVRATVGTRKPVAESEASRNAVQNLILSSLLCCPRDRPNILALATPSNSRVACQVCSYSSENLNS